ncbi:hypothetical protein [Halalkalicoccus tibetensis]|uniref:Uncharacterized protein n=1 Tax=Halalkalicoccus tibetensis TaxID=175632 RepID=A0ABD5V031_9EURY
MTDDPFPTIDADRLDRGGWVLAERTSETVFALPSFRVEGHTRLYEHPGSEAAEGSDGAGGVDGTGPPRRFFFATRLDFEPPLSRLASTSLLPVVRSRATRAFVADLEDRGLEGVKRKGTRRTRTDAGERVRLTRHAARIDVDEGSADVEAWCGVWLHEGEFRAAGGAFPTAGIDGLDPHGDREELFALVRGVE